MEARKLRQYERLPVFIEEDHDEVLPHIHRAIASKHLPLSGTCMVHFDSHPDLLLPLHLKADDVFDKDKVYSELSIENWILPLVYAGHVDNIYWLKPPWADQLPETFDLRFKVGKWKETGELRTTLVDPYFLTEALYAPESQLTNPQEARLSVITITPEDWKFDSNTPASFGSGAEDCTNSSSATEQCITNSAESPDIFSTPKAAKTDADSHIGSGDNSSDKRKICLPDEESKTQENSPDVVKEQQSKYSSPPGSKVRKTDDEGNFSVSTNKTDCEQKAASASGDDADLLMLNQSWLVKLRERLKGKPYILDIDLDFFSTKDPFRNEGSPDQMDLLQKLFEFKLPSEKSEMNAVQFTHQRQTQLDELYEVFQQLHQQPDSVPSVKDPHRQALLDELLQLLHPDSSQQNPVDFEMLYRAGCTFDGTALPHHVSSPQQIQQLMKVVSGILKFLHAPTLITMARSSVDDYCPKEQIETIQESMLEVLDSLYEKVDVKKLYEQPE